MKKVSCFVFLAIMATPALIIPLIICFSCKKPEKEIEVKEFRINKSELSQISKQNPFSKLTLIKIESEGKWFFSSFTKVLDFNNLIYIFDDKALNGNKIISINLEGKIESILNKTGKGPGEYIRIADFDINRNLGEIYVVDQMKKMILIYNTSFIHKGNIRPLVDMPINLISYQERSNTFIIGKGSGRLIPDYNYHIVEIQTNGTVVKKHLPYESTMSSILGGPMRIWSVQDNIDYLPGFSNSIFRINNDTCREAFRFVFGEPMLSYIDYRATHETNNGIYNQSFIESDKYIVFRWGYNEDFYYSIVNKDKNIVKTYKTIQDPTCNCGSSIKFINFLSDDRIVLEANNLNIRHILSIIDPKGDKTINKEILNTLSGESELNEQILILAKLEM